MASRHDPRVSLAKPQRNNNNDNDDDDDDDDDNHDNNDDYHNKNRSNLKAKASCRRPQNIEKCKNMKNVKNENYQKLIIFEGFRQNGLQIQIQRNFLLISTPVKIDFRHSFENDILLTCKSSKTV